MDTVPRTGFRTYRCLLWNSIAVAPIKERPIPTSIEPGSGTFPRAPAPTVMTAKVGDAYQYQRRENQSVISEEKIKCQDILMGA